MISKILRCGAIVAFAASAVAGPSAFAADTGPIEPLLDEMLRAANAHDAKRFMAVYDRSPSLTVTFDDMTIQGWDPLLRQQIQWWDNGKATAVYSNVSAPRITVISDTVVATLQSLKVSPGPDVAGKEAKLTVTSIWKKLPEGWRIVIAHESLTH
jgi:ketosteroid isomerase-like protein